MIGMMRRGVGESAALDIVFNFASFSVEIFKIFYAIDCMIIFCVLVQSIACENMS